VRGYKDLNIDVFLSPSTLRPYVNYTFSKRAQVFDNIEDILKNHFGSDSVITEREEFLKHLKEESKNFKPLGTKVGSFIRELPEPQSNHPGDKKTRGRAPAKG